MAVAALSTSSLHASVRMSWRRPIRWRSSPTITPCPLPLPTLPTTRRRWRRRRQVFIYRCQRGPSARSEEGGGRVEDRGLAYREGREDQQQVQARGSDHQRLGERPASEAGRAVGEGDGEDAEQRGQGTSKGGEKVGVGGVKEGNQLTKVAKVLELANFMRVVGRSPSKRSFF
ncbi:hypothetical protein ZIOFF_021529 [Zingiber officinale]|uniref:Uncharacterized protein n=1 Tax=Zingiber officinale TaxID=94328 RepID=A0A8J5HBW9_ZINOF|nr:hypothetical protein ZIOFF_021529 [Zingiber officinale]